MGAAGSASAPAPDAARAQMCRAEIRWAGSASSGISTSGPASSSRNRTAPDPAHSAGPPIPAIRSTSSCGSQTNGSQIRPPSVVVGGSEDLAAPGVDDGDVDPVATTVEAAPERIEGADAAYPETAAQPECPRSGDPDPQAGERAGPDADRDRVDLIPAPGGLDCPLDLAQKRRRVHRAALLAEAEQRLVADLVPPHGGDGCVLRRRVETEDRQRAGYPFTLKANRPTRLPSTNQVTLCWPGMFEVILLT